MPIMTREKALAVIADLGVSLDNLFIISPADDTRGAVAFWHPQVGLRGHVIERQDIADDFYDFLRVSGARRFRSWGELQAAQKTEKWEGSDTCEDARRLQQVVNQLTHVDAGEDGRADD